jgi:hypothetical protein
MVWSIRIRWLNRVEEDGIRWLNRVEEDDYLKGFQRYVKRLK